MTDVTPTNTYTYTYANSWKDQLTSFNGQSISYDQVGNPTTYKGASLTWARGRNMATYHIEGDDQYFDMCYDASGKRASKHLAHEDPAENEVTTYYIYDGNNLVCEKADDGETVSYKYYLYNSQGVIGFIQDGVTYTYRKNLFGDITAIYQGATKVAEYAYDAWGNCTIVSEVGNIGTRNPFRYRGYYWDNDLQLYYLMSRYYDPQVGRFISADTLNYLEPYAINGLNLYAYCGNNPVNYKKIPVSSDITNGGIYSSGGVSAGLVSPSRVNWKNDGFQIPVWISSLLSGSDFGASIAPAIRTIYQYIRYPGVRDLNKLYGLDFVPGKLNTVCSVMGYVLLGINIALSAWSNFTNDNLTTRQQWISFGVDAAYTLGIFGIGYCVGALVSLIPGFGVFIAPVISAVVTWFIDWTNEKWGWLDNVKQWFNDL